MRYEFHPEALAEFEHAARYYADCQEGLELRFIESIEAAFAQICDAPDLWRIFEQDISSISCSRFSVCCTLLN